MQEFSLLSLLPFFLSIASAWYTTDYPNGALHTRSDIYSPSPMLYARSGSGAGGATPPPTPPGTNVGGHYLRGRSLELEGRDAKHQPPKQPPKSPKDPKFLLPVARSVEGEGLDVPVLSRREVQLLAREAVVDALAEVLEGRDLDGVKRRDALAYAFPDPEAENWYGGEDFYSS